MTMPEGFCYISDTRFIIESVYATTDNFTGRVVSGYTNPNKAILSIPAYEALVKAQDVLDKKYGNFRLKIFDGYRPQMAVDAFVKWAQEPEISALRNRYHPNITKAEIFQQGYVASKSSHSRGGAVDLALVEIGKDGSMIELDMGSEFDLFDVLSHTNNDSISSEARKNRQILIDIMSSAGYVNLPEEWWHFTLENEPYPDKYFNFPIY